MKTLLELIADVALAWREPDYAPREAAVRETLDAPNRFTEEALAFAINQQMHHLTADALAGWLGDRQASQPLTVGVLNAGNVPMVGLQDFLAVLLTGHRYVGSVSSKSPVLLPAFAADLQAAVPDLPVTFTDTETLFAEAEAVIATGNDTTHDWVTAQCEAHHIAPERRLVRGHRFAVAVLDGEETLEAQSGLAEDVLLHEGYGCRNVALIWAPKGLDPDPYFDVMAQFRLVFPAHPAMQGALRMPRAFLASTQQPHAVGEGFLVSRGAPEVQQPGHIRWVDYADPGEVQTWVNAHAASLQLIVASDRVAGWLKTNVPVVPFGEAQRPPLDWCPDGVDGIGFLAGLT